MTADTVARMRDVGIVPAIRADSAAVAVRVARTIGDAGLPIAEITMTTPGATDAIVELTRASGSRLLIGAGMVNDAHTAHEAIEAGARFIVSTCLVPDVIFAAREAGVAVLAGALTPTEVHAAWHYGADFVNVFPADAVGGAPYLRALRGALPHVPLMATGGVNLDSVAAFFASGVAIVGVGGEVILRDAMARGDFGAIGEMATRFVRVVARARRGDG